MSNTLTSLRTQARDALRAAGLDAHDYVVTRIDPPVCIVLGDAPYVSAPVGSNPFKEPYSVRLQVLVITANSSNDEMAEGIDSMLVKVVDALDEDWDINEVEAPSEMTLEGITYLGALVRLAKNTSLKEVI